MKYVNKNVSCLFIIKKLIIIVYYRSSLGILSC